MTLQKSIFGIFLSFGAAWLFAIVLPFFKTRELTPVNYQEGIDKNAGYYFPKRTGLITNGAEIYKANGCYVCHTQVIRPTYAGNDFHRDGWAGYQADPDRGDTRRETNKFDFQGETFAQIGVMRIGQDLSNVGLRYRKLAVEKKTSPEALLANHLVNPLANPANFGSTCPPLGFLFEHEKVEGKCECKPKRNAAGELIPTPDGKALISYLLSLKKDDVVPASMNYAPKQPAEK